MATSFLQSRFRQMFSNSLSWIFIGYQVLQVTKSLNACIMFASLLKVILLFITVVVVCRFGLPTYPNPNLGETSLHRPSPGWTTRTKPRIEWNRGTQPRKKTSDVYLGKRLPCYHFDWIFKFSVKWPSMCEKMVFLPKVQSVWSWMPLKCMELLIEHTQAWISEMRAYYENCDNKSRHKQWKACEIK